MTDDLSCGILTVSDSCFANKKPDLSGPALAKSFLESYPTSSTITAIVPDDQGQIIQQLRKWTDVGINIILTTGGTGFSPRDVTPEATRFLIDREAPGLISGIISKTIENTKMTMLSRAVAGIRDQSLIINFPGSVKGALECFEVVKEIIPHAAALILDNTKRIEKVHNKIATCSKVKILKSTQRPRESSYPILDLEEALKLIERESDIEIGTEVIKLEGALYRVLAENVTAPEDVPAFDASMKDGYAVMASHRMEVRTVKTVIAAGDDVTEMERLHCYEAVRIGTGAPIPFGADAVVQIEDTSIEREKNGEEQRIYINKLPVEGQDIRQSGSDVRKGSILFVSGQRLKAPEIGVLASVGKSTVTVYKKATVAIFSTGNELREHFEDLDKNACQIRDHNRLSLINLLHEHHYNCQDFKIVPDNPNSIKALMETALTYSDVLITTGGVSMGEFDFIKRILIEDFEATIHFGRVNLKPGKPTTFATLQFNGAKKIVFGLPGNPVSAYVTALLFVLPTLKRLERASQWNFSRIPYNVTTLKPKMDSRPEYVRVVVRCIHGKFVAEPNGGQMSSRLNSLVGANGLMFLPGSMSPDITYCSHIILIGDILF